PGLTHAGRSGRSSCRDRLLRSKTGAYPSSFLSRESRSSIHTECLPPRWAQRRRGRQPEDLSDVHLVVAVHEPQRLNALFLARLAHLLILSRVVTARRRGVARLRGHGSATTRVYRPIWTGRPSRVAHAVGAIHTRRRSGSGFQSHGTQCLTTYSIECRPGRVIHVSIMARNPTPTGSGSASPPHPSARTPSSSVRQHLSSSPCPPQPTTCLLARHAQQREPPQHGHLRSSGASMIGLDCTLSTRCSCSSPSTSRAISAVS